MAGTRDRGDPPRHDDGLTRTSAPDGPAARTAAAQDCLAAAFREEGSLLTASVTRILGGDFAAAEEVVQDALLAAWRQWPAGGVPDKPAAWLRAGARRRAIDVLRRDLCYRDRVVATAFPDLAIGATGQARDDDDRLMLIFTCCHPALATEAQVALTLRTVCGLSTAEIARAFLVSEAAIIQRLTRARRKIAAARIPYRAPDGDALPPPLPAVLAVIYLLFNEGYLTSAGDQPQRRDLTGDAEWLAG